MKKLSSWHHVIDPFEKDPLVHLIPLGFSHSHCTELSSVEKQNNAHWKKPMVVQKALLRRTPTWKLEKHKKYFQNAAACLLSMSFSIIFHSKHIHRTCFCQFLFILACPKAAPEAHHFAALLEVYLRKYR